MLPNVISGLQRRFRTSSVSSTGSLANPLLFTVNRCFEIFPLGIGPLGTSAPPNLFNLRQIYDALTNRYDPCAHVEDIFVKSATYCKQNEGSQHEFILLAVADRQAPQFENFLVLDRTSDVPTRKSSQHVKGILSPSYSAKPAKDRLMVSYDANCQNLLEYCNLTPCTRLEELDFSKSQLRLCELVTIAYVASRQHIEYHVLTAQCFWFAGLVWDCINQLHPETRPVVLDRSRRGAFRSWFRQTTSLRELSLITTSVEQEIQQQRSRLAALRAVRPCSL